MEISVIIIIEEEEVIKIEVIKDIIIKDKIVKIRTKVRSNQISSKIINNRYKIVRLIHKFQMLFRFITKVKTIIKDHITNKILMHKFLINNTNNNKVKLMLFKINKIKIGSKDNNLITKPKIINNNNFNLNTKLINNSYYIKHLIKDSKYNNKHKIKPVKKRMKGNYIKLK